LSNLIYIPLILLSGMLGITMINVLTAPRLTRTQNPKTLPLVSVLIPARNEANNIETCLTGLTQQHYPHFEILVLDDQSTDKTSEMVETWVRKDQRIRLIQGEALPDGWTGKNWACHQLSQQAAGEILIFTDADTRHAPNALSSTIYWMQRLRLGLFSAFPQQITHTLAEKLVVPVIDIFVIASLPLWMTYLGRSPLLAAAIGQWLAFTKTAYQQIGGHAVVRSRIVEDVELSRQAKRKRFKILTAVATGVVFSHMYHSAHEVWEGYSKNMFGIFGYQTVLFGLILLTLFSTGVLPYFFLLIPPLFKLGALMVGMNLFMRAIISLKFKHLFWTSVLGHPLGIVYTILIGINSMIISGRGQVNWKDRAIRFRR